MNTPEFKPCPFCGGKSLKITKKRSGKYIRVGDYIQVICNKCKARGPIFEGKHDDVLDNRGHRLYTVANSEVVERTEQLAVEAWNSRAPDTDTICGAWSETSRKLRENK